MPKTDPIHGNGGEKRDQPQQGQQPSGASKLLKQDHRKKKNPAKVFSPRRREAASTLPICPTD
ncbi:MAG: hypothetical protein JO339_21210 [Alphaproteobacteria bacterium]|nr:hypothetical protein [Alphaproteobacteria bacterium]